MASAELLVDADSRLKLVFLSLCYSRRDCVQQHILKGPWRRRKGLPGSSCLTFGLLVNYHIPPWQTTTILRIIADRLTAFCDEIFLFDKQADET